MLHLAEFTRRLAGGGGGAPTFLSTIFLNLSVNKRFNNITSALKDGLTYPVVTTHFYSYPFSLLLSNLLGIRISGGGVHFDPLVYARTRTPPYSRAYATVPS